MKKILIEVYLPATGKYYNIRVPESMNCLIAAHLTAKALSDLSEGAYYPSRSSLFAWHGNGRILNTSHSLQQEHVENGSQLLLI